MDELIHEIAKMAGNAVKMCELRRGGKLDYSEASLTVVEDMLEEAARFGDQLTPDQLTILAQEFGCYILEVGRRQFGGRYCWFDHRDQPVLVVGEPTFRVAILASDKVRGRLSGDDGNNIPFFYDGFADRARRAKAGDDVLYV